MKNAESLERLERVATLVIDKTGTLTGENRALSIIVPGKISQDELLRLAASLDCKRTPAGERCSGGSCREGASTGDAREVQITSPAGDHRPSRQSKIAIGSRKLLEENGVDTSSATGKAEELRADGGVVLVAIDGELAGLLGVLDPIKASTPEAIDALRADESGWSCFPETAEPTLNRLAVSLESIRLRQRFCPHKRARS